MLLERNKNSLVNFLSVAKQGIPCIHRFAFVNSKATLEVKVEAL